MTTVGSYWIIPFIPDNNIDNVYLIFSLAHQIKNPNHYAKDYKENICCFLPTAKRSYPIRYITFFNVAF